MYYLYIFLFSFLGLFLSTLFWYFFKVNSQLLIQNQALLQLARENSARLRALEIESSKLKEGGTIVDNVVTDNVMFLGVGLLLLVVVMGFVVFYSRGTNIDVGQVVSSSNSLQSEVIHDQIMCAKKDLGEVMMELGVKSCQNQAGIIKGVLKLENRVSSGILDSSSERAEILESVTSLDDRLASYVSTSSLEQAHVLEKVAKLDNRLTEHLLNSSVGNAGILEKVIKIDESLTEHLLTSSAEKADSLKLDILFDIMMNSL